MSIAINIFKTLAAYRERAFHPDREHTSGFQGTKGKAEQEGTSRAGADFIILIVVLSRIHIDTHTHIHIQSVKIYQIVYFKYMQFIVCPLYFNGAIFKIMKQGGRGGQSTFQERSNLDSTSSICKCPPHYTFVSTVILKEKNTLLI